MLLAVARRTPDTALPLVSRRQKRSTDDTVCSAARRCHSDIPLAHLRRRCHYIISIGSGGSPSTRVTSRAVELNFRNVFEAVFGKKRSEPPETDLSDFKGSEDPVARCDGCVFNSLSSADRRPMSSSKFKFSTRRHFLQRLQIASGSGFCPVRRLLSSQSDSPEAIRAIRARCQARFACLGLSQQLGHWKRV